MVRLKCHWHHTGIVRDDLIVAASLTSFEKSSDYNKLLSVGRLVASRGYKRMMQVFSDAVRVESRFRQNLVGEGDTYKELKKDARMLNITDEVFS